MVVRVGEDVSLHCPLLETPSGTLSWYRKFPGRPPELILSTRPGWDGRFGPTFGPDRVRSAADGSLVLQAVQRRDAGFYFCSRHTSRRSKQEMMQPVTTIRV